MLISLKVGEEVLSPNYESEVRRVYNIPDCGKERDVVPRCEKKVKLVAKKKIAKAIQEWNKTSGSSHALETVIDDKNTGKQYKNKNIEVQARMQASTGQFPNGVRRPNEFFLRLVR
jgi:hypothetical protein